MLSTLKVIKCFIIPSNVRYLSKIIHRNHLFMEHKKTFNRNDLITGCKVLKNKALCAENHETFVESMNKVLTFIKNNRILVTADMANEFQLALRKFKFNSSIGSVTKQGKCESCQKRLRNIHVTDEEFNNLASHFEQVLISESKATSQELESFNKFIDSTKPHDIVVDGLNMSYMRNGKIMEPAKGLARVVKNFVYHKKTVLVIGRQHMEKWSKVQMNYIRENSNLFLIENSSQDDPFFLFSTLKSGPNTDFVTCDLLRDHARKLDGNLRAIFRRWQQLHQYTIQMIDDYGRITYKKPIKFDMNVQQVDGCWHIPFENNSHCRIDGNHFELRKNWLCVSKEADAIDE